MSASAAVAACREYEHWASEVPRLSAEIGAVRCPHEVPYVEHHEDEFVPSCFGRAKLRAVEVAWGETRPPNLDEIASEVIACAACCRLVQLIRARKHARQRYGVAKREVRRVGKLPLAADEAAPTTPQGAR